MSFFSKIFGSAAKGVANGVVDTAKGVSEIVEKWVPSEAARHEMQQEVQKLVNEAVASARSYDPRSSGATVFAEVVNTTVDAIARLIRPAVTIMFVGAIFGAWELETRNTDPFVLAGFESVMIFWFGSRVLIKDIPSLIKQIKGLK